MFWWAAVGAVATGVGDMLKVDEKGNLVLRDGGGGDWDRAWRSKHRVMGSLACAALVGLASTVAWGNVVWKAVRI